MLSFYHDEPDKAGLCMHWTNSVMTAVLGLFTFLFGILWDLLRYGPALKQSQLWSYYILNLLISIIMGLTLLCSAALGIFVRGKVKNVCHFTELLIGTIMASFGLCMWLLTNASSGNAEANYTADLVLTDYGRAQANYNSVASGDHSFFVNQDDITSDLLDLFVGTAPGTGMGISAVFNQIHGVRDDVIQDSLYCRKEDMRDGFNNIFGDACVTGPAMVDLGGCLGAGLLCMLNVTLDMLSYQWFAGIVWVCVGLAIIFNAIFGAVVTNKLNPNPPKDNIKIRYVGEDNALMGAQEQWAEENFANAVSEYHSQWKPGTSKGAPVAARAQGSRGQYGAYRSLPNSREGSHTGSSAFGSGSGSALQAPPAARAQGSRGQAAQDAGSAPYRPPSFQGEVVGYERWSGSSGPGYAQPAEKDPHKSPRKPKKK